MKITLGLLLVLLVILGIGAAGVNDDKNIPPGIPADHWVAVNDCVGLIISEPRPEHYEVVRKKVVPQGVEDPASSAVAALVPTGFSADAILMAKVRGKWCRLNVVPRPVHAELLQ